MIAANHSLVAIHGYTFDQILMFLREANEADKRESRLIATGIALALALGPGERD